MHNLIKPEEHENFQKRKKSGFIWRFVFYAATSIAILSLVILLFTILNNSFGYIAVNYKTTTNKVLQDKKLSDLNKEQLIEVIYAFSKTDEDFNTDVVETMEEDKPFSQRSKEELDELFIQNVLAPNILKSWDLLSSLFKKTEVLADIKELQEENPNLILEFRSWISLDMLTNKQSSDPNLTGIRSAILGSLWMILITLVIALPLGIATAIYLEEYASNNWFNRLIQLNIYNLSGVPSIIFGLLGLAIFVRALEPFTSGAFFSSVDVLTQNGRTIISAGLTLSLLVLPIIIINTQEAIKAVPSSLRESSYGLGATKWQTIFHHVLPATFERIMTGAILAVSRAIGETAPLVVVGASTFIVFDPASIFSKFTVLPIQIYQWTSRPEGEFRHVAAAAIIILLVLLLTLNASAIMLRNRSRKKRIIG